MAGRTGAPPTPDVYSAEAAAAAQGDPKISLPLVGDVSLMGALKTGVGSLLSPFSPAIGAIGAKGEIDAANRMRQMNLPPHLYTEGREAYLQSLQGIKEQLEEKGISVLDAFELAKDALGRGKDAPFTPQDLENMQAYSDLGAETGVYNPGDIPPLSQAIYSGPVFTTPKRDGQSVTYQYEDD